MVSQEIGRVAHPLLKVFYAIFLKALPKILCAMDNSYEETYAMREGTGAFWFRLDTNPKRFWLESEPFLASI